MCVWGGVGWGGRGKVTVLLGEVSADMYCCDVGAWRACVGEMREMEGWGRG